MGASESTQINQEDEEEDDEGEEENDNGEETEPTQLENDNPLMKKVLEQEPEMLPCHSSASPLSPQLSTFGTPRMGPSIKVWDPYNVLAPPQLPPPPPTFSRCFLSNGMEFDQCGMTEVYLIAHGECGMSLRPDLIGGRWEGTDLTTNGKRQARALAVFLNSQGVRFNAVYSSPLDRAKETAVSVCQELNFSEEQIHTTDDILEMSQGQWEGSLRSDIYTSDMMSIIERFQPDFSAPSGESLRQVEFRMIQFLNETVLKLPEKLRLWEISLHHQNDNKAFSRDPVPNGDLLQRHRQVISRKKSGKSRLQFVTKTGDHETEDEISYRENNTQDHLNEENVGSSSSNTVGIFTHPIPIKCIITGLLGCGSGMSQHQICIDDSSMTVLQHSLKTGWQIKRLNDTAHLRLL
ncbi:hypothetical protein GIB67_041886 [Kingdonia uniflora]|uniref:Phosphoglycerate mutase n=1 Tax=Kingdonia uniflora TaxID=39325 RepID=A0A7J7L605_9MAGN|nr:hypothetical protein GIB67_041886 [Kingdonia uniflora]